MTRSLLLLSLAAFLMGCTSPESESETRISGRDVLDASTLRVANAGKVSFTDQVKPVLQAKCVMCHNQAAQPGRMSLANHAEAVKTGTLGIFIVPGKPDSSRFITHVGSAHASVKAMPPVGETLTENEVKLLRRWIAQGAEWPAGAAGTLDVSH